MLATVLPWTIHNYRSYGRFILISTNGGSVFYTANNAHANASYSEESQQALPKDPIAADKEGYRLGKQWVRQHPAAFVVLAIRKQVVFLGDDGDGVYEGLKRGRSPSALQYNVLKGITSLYWFGLWLGLLCCYKPFFRSRDWAELLAVAFLPFAYQWAIDSVFESGSRHHMAHVACIAILLSVSLASVTNQSSAISRRRTSYRMPCPI